MQLEQAFAVAIHLVLDAQSTDLENDFRPWLQIRLHVLNCMLYSAILGQFEKPTHYRFVTNVFTLQSPNRPTDDNESRRVFLTSEHQ